MILVRLVRGWQALARLFGSEVPETRPVSATEVTGGQADLGLIDGSDFDGRLRLPGQGLDDGQHSGDRHDEPRGHVEDASRDLADGLSRGHGQRGAGGRVAQQWRERSELLELRLTLPALG